MYTSTTCVCATGRRLARDTLAAAVNELSAAQEDDGTGAGNRAVSTRPVAQVAVMPAKHSCPGCAQRGDEGYPLLLQVEPCSLPSSSPELLVGTLPSEAPSTFCASFTTTI